MSEQKKGDTGGIQKRLSEYSIILTFHWKYQHKLMTYFIS